MRRKTQQHALLDDALRAAEAEVARGDPPGLIVSRPSRARIFQWRAVHDYVHVRAAISIRDLPSTLQGVRLLHLSDLHLGLRWGRAYDKLIEQVQADPPDLILFTGDFVEDRYDHRVGLPLVLRLFAGLKATHGVYGILGNHDPDVMMPRLIDAGLRFITHERVVLQLPTGQLELIGFPGPSRRDLDPDFLVALPPRAAGVPRIVLSHYPDLFGHALLLDPDLYLAGHTHGGQICLPNGWPPLTHDRMPRRFAKGIHRIGRTWYAVSNGLGFTGISARLFCPAEVTEFVLEQENSL